MKKGAAWRNRPEGDLIMSSTCEISPHEDFNRWQLNRSAQPTASRPPAYERSRVVFTKHGREPLFVRSLAAKLRIDVTRYS